MVSRPRVSFSGALYHLYNRGNGGQLVFRDQGDRRRFLALLEDILAKQDWRLHTYCLMSNHYHLLIETSAPTLAQGMQHLGAVYSRWFNHKHRTYGHVFQGRYRSVLVDRQSYLLELTRYILLNPVRAGLVDKPEDWPWSSYGATIGRDAPGQAASQLVTRDWLLEPFAGPAAAAGQTPEAAFARFVAEGQERDRMTRDAARLEAEAKGGLLGSADFRAIHKAAVALPRPGSVAAAESRPSLSALQSAHGQVAPRGLWMAEARRHGYRLKAIAKTAGLSESRVSRLIKAAEAETSS